jgi:hypothetical protein
MSNLKSSPAFPQLPSQKMGARRLITERIRSDQKPNLPDPFMKTIGAVDGAPIPQLKFSVVVGSSQHVPQIGSVSARLAEKDTEKLQEAPIALTARPPAQPRAPPNQEGGESTGSRTAKQRSAIKDSMSPADALKKWEANLTPYEQAEILDYPNIYFVGSSSKKIRYSVALDSVGVILHFILYWLYNVVFYYIIFYYIMLYYIILYYIILYYIILYYIILYYII